MQAIVINVTGVDNPFIAQTIIGRELTLSKAEITRLNTGNFIEVSGFKLFKQDLQIEEDKGEVFSTIFNKLNKTWHRVEDPYTALSDAFELNYNVLFFGKGGFGKQAIVSK